jgi:hypothetical protein
MLIRSLTLATLLAVAGPLFAADGDSPLDLSLIHISEPTRPY